MQVASKACHGVGQELVVTDLESEVHSRNVRLGIREGHLIHQADDNRESTRCVVPCFAHIWAEVGRGRVAGLYLNQDFVRRNTHDQRTKSLDQGRDRLVTVHLPERSDPPEYRNVGISWLCSHECWPPFYLELVTITIYIC